MCETWIMHYVYNCDFSVKWSSNDCDENCTKNNIRYINNDVMLQKKCVKCAVKSQYFFSNISSNSSASETSDE